MKKDGIEFEINYVTVRIRSAAFIFKNHSHFLKGIRKIPCKEVCMFSQICDQLPNPLDFHNKDQNFLEFCNLVSKKSPVGEDLLPDMRYEGLRLAYRDLGILLVHSEEEYIKEILNGCFDIQKPRTKRNRLL